jgi:hypothetical protein
MEDDECLSVQRLHILAHDNGGGLLPGRRRIAAMGEKVMEKFERFVLEHLDTKAKKAAAVIVVVIALAMLADVIFT